MSKYELLLSSNSGLYSARREAPRFSLFEAVDFLSKMGFEAVDVNFSPSIDQTAFGHDPMLDGDEWRERMEKLRDYAAQKGLQIPHTHAPFRYNYLDLHNPLFPMWDGMMHRSIEATAILGGKHIVVHPTVTEDRRSTLIGETVKGLAPLAEYGRAFGVRLAVENMTSTRPETLAEIADRLDADVCWDVGHANIAGIDQERAVELLAQRLQVLHLHDNFGPLDADSPSRCDLHQPPFFGNVDWDGFLRGLKHIGYQGPFNYEVASKKVPEPLREVHAGYMVKAAEELMKRMK
jgi:sugar phosphate isomerase/epimerase